VPWQRGDVRRVGGEDDQIKVLRGYPGVLQGGLRSLHGEIRRANIELSDAPLPYPSLRGYPLVARIDVLGLVLVFHHLRREVGARPTMPIGFIIPEGNVAPALTVSQKAELCLRRVFLLGYSP
jgi:hypothetical protein